MTASSPRTSRTKRQAQAARRAAAKPAAGKPRTPAAGAAMEGTATDPSSPVAGRPSEQVSERASEQASDRGSDRASAAAPGARPDGTDGADGDSAAATTPAAGGTDRASAAGAGPRAMPLAARPPRGAAPTLSSLAPAPAPGRRGTVAHAAVDGTRSVEAAATGRGGARGAVVGVLESRATEATAAAFDLLYATVAPRLTWQTYLLTAHRHRAAHCVRRAFQLAWTNWETVSADTSPEGWVRAAAFELALSPWHTGGPRMQHLMHLPHRRLRTPDGEENLTRRDKALMSALMRLPRPQRRALVLHDVIGLDWAQTAVEVEGSTPVTFGRVALARRALATAVPGIVGPDSEAPGFGRRVGEQLRATAGRALGDGDQPERQPHLAPAQRTRVRARLHDGGVTAAAGALTLATAGGLAAALIWGTPLHPSEQPFVNHRQPTPVDQAVHEPTPRPNQPLTHTIPVTHHLPPDSAADAVDTGAQAERHPGGGEGARSHGGGTPQSPRQPAHHSAPHAPPHAAPHAPPHKKHR